jgi:hypothetical protein
MRDYHHYLCPPNWAPAFAGVVFLLVKDAIQRTVYSPIRSQ